MKKIIALFLLISLMISLIACGAEPVESTASTADSSTAPISSSQNETDDTAGTTDPAWTTESTRFPANPVGIKPTTAEVEIYVGNETVDCYREFLCSYLYEGGYFVNGDGRGMFVSSPQEILSKVPEYTLPEGETLRIYVNDESIKKVRVFDAETCESVHTSRLPAFAEEAEESSDYYVNALTNCLDTGRYVIQFTATTGGTGDYAEQYTSDLCLIILNITAADNDNMRPITPVVKVQKIVEGPDSELYYFPVSTYSELLYMFQDGHIMDGRLMFYQFKEIYDEIKDKIPTVILDKNNLLVTVNGEVKNTTAVYRINPDSTELPVEKLANLYDPSKLREELAPGRYILGMDCRSDGTGEYSNDRIVYSHHLCVVIQ